MYDQCRSELTRNRAVGSSIGSAKRHIVAEAQVVAFELSFVEKLGTEAADAPSNGHPVGIIDDYADGRSYTDDIELWKER